MTLKDDKQLVQSMADELRERTTSPRRKLFDVFVKRQVGSVFDDPKSRHSPSAAAMLMVERECFGTDGGDFSFTLPDGEVWTVAVALTPPPVS